MTGLASRTALAVPAGQEASLAVLVGLAGNCSCLTLL